MICTLMFAFLMTGALLVCVLLGGCTRKVYVPVEHTRIEYRDADTTALMSRWQSLMESMRQTERTTDSVVDREKESVTLNDRGDTVRLTRDHYIYVSSKSEKELEREVHEKDSIIESLKAQMQSIKTDSIPVPYPVERKLSKWEQTKMDFGGMFLGGLIAVVVSAVIVWIVKRKKRK